MTCPLCGGQHRGWEVSECNRIRRARAALNEIAEIDQAILSPASKPPATVVNNDPVVVNKPAPLVVNKPRTLDRHKPRPEYMREYMRRRRAAAKAPAVEPAAANG